MKIKYHLYNKKLININLSQCKRKKGIFNNLYLKVFIRKIIYT